MRYYKLVNLSRQSCVHGGAAAWAVWGQRPDKSLVGWAIMHLAPPIIGLHFRILQEELVNGYKNFNTRVCRIVSFILY